MKQAITTDCTSPQREHVRGYSFTNEHHLPIQESPMMMNTTMEQLREPKLAGMAQALQIQLN